jgi:hypothetical protein
MRTSRSDPVAVSVAVKEIKNDDGRLACELAGLVIAGAPPGTRTPNPRIKSRGHGPGRHRAGQVSRRPALTAVCQCRSPWLYGWLYAHAV